MLSFLSPLLTRKPGGSSYYLSAGGESSFWCYGVNGGGVWIVSSICLAVETRVLFELHL